MTGVFCVPYLATESLIKLCNRANCLNDRVVDTRFCKDHQAEKRQRPKRYKGKTSYLEGTYQSYLRTTLYFISCKDAGAVKIGVTDNLKMRFINLQSSSPLELEIITHFMCPNFYEEKVHDLLTDCRIRGEWFVMDRVLSLLKDIGPRNQEKQLKRILFERDV